eukprot:Hpha_TRINITY_DN36272_c0_g1::TRINITY_DN36272_c0_g1_i1::g.83286::m.83286
MAECEAAPLPGAGTHPPPSLSAGAFQPVAVQAVATGQPVLAQPAGGVAQPQMQVVHTVTPSVGGQTYLGPQSVEVAIGQPVQLVTQPVGQAVSVGQAIRQGGIRYSQHDWQAGCCWTSWCGCCGFCCVAGDASLTGAKVGCGWHSVVVSFFLLLLAIVQFSFDGDRCDADHSLVHGCLELGDCADFTVRGALHFGNCTGSFCGRVGNKCCRSAELAALNCPRARDPDECSKIPSWGGSGLCMWVEGECVNDCAKFWAPARFHVAYAVITLLLALGLAGIGVSLLIYAKKRTQKIGLRWTACC